MKLTFGKHKGEDISNVPSDYLVWAYDNIPKLDSGIKKYIQKNEERLRNEAATQRSQYLYDLCDGEVSVEY